ncbi:serine/threonine protein kinase [Kangiella koreensis]|uniref:Serine/threonine protein kinase n=1 Tax=Kangiella koreensis (strain DSM 16069 / JCM 12317 / KCTC 12182 / SW-125) TaxID=523791 RepID=C7R6K1_KANKD|nr:serine/threonine-protein kinase [Kangiella koreensis]ACV27429.1 serine/threonine protein kinase [Kangiella koreensis DSM 16069]
MTQDNDLRIGRYKLVKEIGRGAMSVVYQAEDPEIGRMLAIKLLKHELVEKEEYRELFLREAKAAGRLGHPGIVTIYDVGIWQERPFIAMELLEGQNLDEYLQQNGTFSLEQASDLAKQLALALDYAHQNGVIHRDLKPDNILVLDGGRRFKITDFGIAHVEHLFLEDEGGKSKDKIMGTPAYMSPEQITGHGVDFKTDLYSLGVILYQVTKGELPFQAPNYAAMMQAVLHLNPQPINIVSEQGFMWQSIIFRLLQKNPDHRYPTSDELLEEIETLTKELTQNKEGLAGIRFVSMRARWAISLSAVVLLVMILGMVWVYNKQNKLMNQLVFDYGNSMVQIISQETREPLLLEERITLQELTRDIAGNSQIRHLSIRDKDGIVQSSSQPEQISKPFSLPPASQIQQKTSDAQIYSNLTDYDQEVVLFDSQIKYQDKVIGNAFIAISRSNLKSATQSSLLAMIIWMFLIMLAVFSGVYWLANRFIQRVNETRHVIRELRNHGEADILKVDTHDEVGRLQQEVNDLSQKLAGLTQTQYISTSPDPSLLETITDLDKTLIISQDEADSEIGKDSG